MIRASTSYHCCSWLLESSSDSRSVSITTLDVRLRSSSARLDCVLADVPVVIEVAVGANEPSDERAPADVADCVRQISKSPVTHPADSLTIVIFLLDLDEACLRSIGFDGRIARCDLVVLFRR